jgi:DUF2075 family protein
MESARKSDTNASSSSRSWYDASIAQFLLTQTDAILGRLTTNSDFALIPTQRDAWIAQIEFLRANINGLTGSVFLEFNIPRMGRRIDVVLIIGAVVFVIEFKVGEKNFDRAAVDQVWDYALDLKNFHEASHSVAIVPILIATEAAEFAPIKLQVDDDKVYRPILVNTAGFRTVVDLALQTITGSALDDQRWSRAPYHPTPTIVEAARSLYAQHSVEAIARYDAGAKNLHVTSRRIEELVDEAKAKNRKIICFVTGVPGAGKTLVGLNIATRRREPKAPTHAVFLSGNAPLVAVLCEALTRDEVARRKKQGEKVRKGKIAESVKAFIQNVHHFRDDALIESSPPIEHVVIFDEAQRAWNLQQTANFMQRKKKRAGFSQSEPEFLISYMDRHKDWAAIIWRSFRAENVSAFIKALLDCEKQQAREAFTKLSSRYPIAITRDLNLAKQWIRQHARGTERFGMVASSKAQRLKPHAIDIRVDVNPVHWFLNEKEDTRSSYYLEDAATEFQVQGLELDWACVNWDGDLRFADSGWSFHDFCGDRWRNIHNKQDQVYLRNAYRVLLTRARQGMVLFVPPGEPRDPTRSSAYYDSTFDYLTGLGIPVLK